MSPGPARVMSYTKLSASISSWVITCTVTLDWLSSGLVAVNCNVSLIRTLYSVVE